MELYQLRTFVVVAEERSITRAAERLFTTPPSVSAHVKALEEELGVALFSRTPKGMVITAKGEQLRLEALATLASAQRLRDRATELRGELLGTVSLGLNAPVGALRVPDVLAHLEAHAPGIDLRLVASSTGRIIDSVAASELDIGFAFGDVPAETLSRDTLGELALVVAVPARWAGELAGGDWRSLAKFPWVYSDKYCPFQVLTDRMLAAHGLTCRRVTATDDEGAKQALVESGVGITMLLEAEARDGVERGTLAVWPGDPLGIELSLVHASRRAGEPVLGAVRDAVLSAWDAGGAAAAAAV